MSDAPAAAIDLSDRARPLTIAIDGPAGSGKSTVAREVARRLGYRYLDTGAMYRAVTWLALERGVSDDAGLATLATALELHISTDPDDLTVTVGAVDVTTAIRSREVSAAVSRVSAVPGVRQVMVARQRRLAGRGGIVVEGRDIGSVVLPDAPVKIFLTASGSARAERRAGERGDATSAAVAATVEELARRDRLDATRAVSPLAKADDAVEIDTTPLTVDQVVAAVLERCLAALTRAGAATP